MRTKKIALPFLFLLILTVFSSLLLVTATTPPQTLSVTISTDKTSIYNNFDPITLSGNVNYDVSGQPNTALVAIEVDSPATPIILRTVQTAGGETGTPNTQETITSAYPTGTPEGSQVDSFANGTEAYFTVTVSNQDSTAYSNMLLAVTIFDGNGSPLGIGYDTLSMGAGSTQPAYPEILIPASAHTGTAYGYADLYSNYPKDGGVPMAQENAFTFKITGKTTPSIGPAPATRSSTPGAYSFTFRLNSAWEGCIDNGYKVYATATYALDPETHIAVNAPLATTGFNVQLIGDFNFATTPVNGLVVGVVNGNDLFIFANSYILYYEGSNNWNTLCDINQDQKMDSNDFFLFVAAYVQYWSSF